MNTTANISQDFQEQYASQVSDHLRWFDSARSLFSSAQLLEPRISALWSQFDTHLKAGKHLEGLPWEVIQHQSVYMMLCAFSIENLLKGQIIKNDRKTIYDEVLRSRKLPRHLTTHDLLRLAADCGIDLTDLSKKMLHRLSRQATWIGRYPIGASSYSHYHLVKPKLGSPEAGWFPGQMTVVNDLVNSVAGYCEVQMNIKWGRHANRSPKPTE